MKYVYKIISALGALAVLPALVFAPYIYYFVSSTALQGLFTVGQLAGNETIINAMEEYGLEKAPTGIADSVSVYGLTDIVSLVSGNETSADVLQKIEMVIPSFLAMCFAFLLIVICAIITAVFAIVCKDNRKVIASSFAGVTASLLFVMLFDNTVEPFVSGTIRIMDIVDSLLAPFIAQIEELSIAPIFYLIPAIFGFIALWTVLYNATLPEKEKAERLKMIG
ncbi:MAG: hypothetical protein IKT89_03905 [Clostridia bacterium]|nr:hypothetical protein [Clostridia bacterium]